MGASARVFAAPAHAASDQLVNFEDGTIGLRFQYLKGWRCRGTGARRRSRGRQPRGGRTSIAVHESNCRGCFHDGVAVWSHGLTG